jgi:hypothetical protein
MAYKFQLGDARLSGSTTFEQALVGESTISGAAGSFDALAGTSLALQSGGITAAGAIAGATTIDASGDLTVGSITNAEFTVDSSGNTDIDGTLNVEGVPTFQAAAVFSGGITTAGAIAGATTVSGSGQFSMSHIDLDGTLNAGGKVTVVGVSDLDGGIDVNASKFTVSTAGAVVADSTVSGAAGTFDALAGTSLALQSGGITAAGAIAGATTISGSGAISGLSLDIEKGADFNSGGLTNAGAIAGATTIDASGDLTVGSITNAEFTVDSSGNTDIDGTLNVEGVPTFQAGAVFSGGITTAGAIAGASTISGSSTISGHALDIETTVSASSFWGDGAGITNINVENLDAAGSDKFLQFNQNGEFAANAGLQYSGTGSVVVSGSSSGMQSGEIAFGTAASKIGQIYVEDDGGYVMMMKNSQGGIDMSASEGVAVYLPDGQGFAVANAMGMDFAISLKDAMSDNEVALMSGSGVISGSSTGKFHALESGQGKFTVSAAGAVVVDSIKTDGNEFVVSTAGLVTSTGIANSSAGMTAVGSIAGATTISASSTLQVGGAVTMASLGNATVSLTDDLMIIDDGAVGAIKTTSLAAYATAIAGAGMTSTAGALNVIASTNAGIDVAADAIKLDLSDLAAGTVNVAADSIAIVDADDANKSKLESIADLVSGMAGTGITATNGVLSISSVSTPTAFGSYATLVEGLNYANVTLTGATELNLPAASALENGEYVKIKMAAGVSSTNTVTVNVGNGSDSIDGDSSIVLESPFAAVDLYRVAANTWRIM